MDPDFQRAITIVLVAGTLFIAAAAVTLYIIFRRFGSKGAAGQSHMALMAGLVAFVFLACVLLFLLSYSRW